VTERGFGQRQAGEDTGTRLAAGGLGLQRLAEEDLGLGQFFGVVGELAESGEGFAVFRIQFERGLEGGGSRIQLTFEQMGAAEVIVEVRRVSDSLRSLRQTGDRFGIVLLSEGSHAAAQCALSGV